MSAPATSTQQGCKPYRKFLLGFALVALFIAGAVSYLASSSPDGLDSATLKGCTETEAGELVGTCIAQQAGGHAMTGSPLAGYTIGGDEGLLGVSGVLGVMAVFVLAGGLFWLLARNSAKRRT